MDITVAQQFLRDNDNAVLVTWRRDGRPQMSPVTVGLDAAGRAIISSTETTYKCNGLQSKCLRTAISAFFGPHYLPLSPCSRPHYLPLRLHSSAWACNPLSPDHII
jgi:hypothetical protein